MGRGDSYQLQGLQGGVVLGAGDSTAAGDEFRWLQFVSDSVLTSVTSNLAGDSLVGPTFTAGSGIGGIFSGITVTSGLVIAYKL